MVKVDNSASLSYVYDVDGRRVKAPGYEALYDLDGRAVVLLDSTNGTMLHDEIYAGGLHLASYVSGTTYFNHTDWLGTLRANTGVNGAVTGTCSGLPFGDARNCTGTIGNANLFTDALHDNESNLEHTWFRQLSTTQGRWLTPDPYMGSMDLTNPQSLNRYLYVENSPTNLIDPFGLQDQDPGQMYARMPIFGRGGCKLDAFTIGCGVVGTLLSSGAGAICPNNDCTGVRTGPNGQWQIWFPHVHTAMYPNLLKEATADFMMYSANGYWKDVQFVNAWMYSYEPTLLQRIDNAIYAKRLSMDLAFNAWMKKHDTLVHTYTYIFSPDTVNAMPSMAAELRGGRGTPFDTSDGAGGLAQFGYIRIGQIAMVDRRRSATALLQPRPMEQQL